MTDIICPSCQDDLSIESMKLWEVYEEDGRETHVDCPGCGVELIITSIATGWDLQVEANE